jgi:hypothetical protein
MTPTTKFKVETMEGVGVIMTLGTVNFLLPFAYAGLLARDLLIAMMDDLTARRSPTTVEGGPVKVPLLGTLNLNETRDHVEVPE